jgi:putative Mg2+ transporter-C (MgtC) family protein
MDILEITLKLLLALALGGLVGFERESSQKPAGLRTNILICLGATMMMILSQLFLQSPEAGVADSLRLAAAVITGIGFIGAGTIIQAQGMVIGLTTAATLWAVAGLGLVVGAGFYPIALIYTAILILTLNILGRFEDVHLKKSIYRYSITSLTSKDTLISIKKLALHEGIKFREISHKKEGDHSIISLTFQAPEDKEDRFNQSITNLEDIIEIKIE